MTQSDARRFVRVEFHADAHLNIDGQSQPVDIDELSLKGATVSLRDDASVADANEGELHLVIGEDGLEITMSVAIRNRDDQRLGLEWTGIDIDSLGRLRRLIELNSGDPSEVSSELSSLAQDTP